MASKETLIGLALLLNFLAIGPCIAQDLGLGPYRGPGICKEHYCNNLTSLQSLQDCVVVMGNLYIVKMENTTWVNFTAVSFPKLREVTGFLLLYRVQGLDSLGRLFPNLARIRGNNVSGNFGLVVFDLGDLEEVGLYSLRKIDRGGVMVLGNPACYVHSVDWRAIAPRAQLKLSPPLALAHCRRNCTCSCWNNKKCQRFVSGPKAESCDTQCLGCGESPTQCAVCRHRTFRGRCVQTCPPETLLLEENEYCLSEAECEQVGGWAWRGSCVTRCPVGYEARGRSCQLCENCQTCGDLMITTVDSMQRAEACVFVNGSLTVHARALPEVMVELARGLRRVRVIAGYVAIYASHFITSLDFLSSLQIIRGQSLRNKRHSLIVYGMTKLTSLFSTNVTKNLIIENGTLNFFDNPVLCMRHINEISKLFPNKPNEFDLPQGMNGYSGSCKEVAIGLKVSVNDTTATVQFLTIRDPRAHYTILFAKVPPQDKDSVPESCSQSAWSTLSVNNSSSRIVSVQLHHLNPASRYALCVEMYDPSQRNLARSKVIHFSTVVGKPAPPFITKLVAISDDAVDIRWLDHEDYRSHINKYKIDVSLIEFDTDKIVPRNYCRYDMKEVHEPTRHGAAWQPPARYSACPAAPAPSPDAGDHWLALDAAHDCDEYEPELHANTTHAGYISTVIINVDSTNRHYQIRGLAPYRDYRFRLRACTETVCSRSTHGVVRTLRSEEADIVIDLSASANEAGELTVTWKPPKVLNGALLAYFVHVVKIREEDEKGHPVPRSWCVPGNVFTVTSRVESSKSLVRVCSWTLGSESACTSWLAVSTSNIVSTSTYFNWWYVVWLVGIAVWLFSIIASRFWKPKLNYNDKVPLIDSTCMYRSVTEPPDITASDFDPLYLISIRDSDLD